MRPLHIAFCIVAATATPALATDAAKADLTDRIWVQNSGDTPPGAMQLFLDSGALLTTSCWEGYRLSEWRWVDDTHIEWEEDGMTIPAKIVSLSEDELVLELTLVSEVVTQTFAPAEVPYVCPDMPR